MENKKHMANKNFDFTVRYNELKQSEHDIQNRVDK